MKILRRMGNFSKQRYNSQNNPRKILSFEKRYSKEKASKVLIISNKKNLINFDKLKFYSIYVAKKSPEPVIRKLSLYIYLEFLFQGNSPKLIFGFRSHFLFDCWRWEELSKKWVSGILLFGGEFSNFSRILWKSWSKH